MLLYCLFINSLLEGDVKAELGGGLLDALDEHAVLGQGRHCCSGGLSKRMSFSGSLLKLNLHVSVSASSTPS